MLKTLDLCPNTVNTVVSFFVFFFLVFIYVSVYKVAFIV